VCLIRKWLTHHTEWVEIESSSLLSLRLMGGHQTSLLDNTCCVVVVVSVKVRVSMCTNSVLETEKGKLDRQQRDEGECRVVSRNVS